MKELSLESHEELSSQLGADSESWSQVHCSLTAITSLKKSTSEGFWMYLILNRDFNRRGEKKISFIQEFTVCLLIKLYLRVSRCIILNSYEISFEFNLRSLGASRRWGLWTFQQANSSYIKFCSRNIYTCLLRPQMLLARRAGLPRGTPAWGNGFWANSVVMQS